jgi:hypothetical protein
LGFRINERGEGTAVLEPFSGRATKFTQQIPSRYMLTWLDSGQLVDGERDTLTVRDAGSGRVIRTVRMPDGEFPMSLATAPPSAPGPFIGTLRRHTPSATVISFFRKDLTPGRPVWTGGAEIIGAYPRVDMMGEYVAWTMIGGGGSVAMKHVNQRPSDLPTMLKPPQGFSQMYFCDWTDQGTLLCNAARAGGGTANRALIILDRDGKLLRTLATAVPPAAGVTASWRKYGHQ